MYKLTTMLISILTFLALFSVNSGAEESCSAILLSEKIGVTRNTSYFNFNNKMLPEPDGQTIYVFKGLSGKNTLKAQDNYSFSDTYRIRCNENSLNYIEFNNFDLRFRKLTEAQTRAKTDSRVRVYRQARYFRLEGEHFVEYAKKRLPPGGSLASIYAELNHDGGAATVLAGQPASGSSKPSAVAAVERLLAARAAKARSTVSKPAAVATTKTSSARPPVKSKAATNRYAVAVIVGNRNYATHNRDVPNVDYAHNDADQIYRYVIETLGYRDGNVILLKDATQADLVGTFGRDGNAEGKLYDWVRAGKSDVFVYYSGHGAPGLSNGQGYLLPVDSNPNKVELNGFPLKTLYENLSKIPAKSMTIVMDACFSGGSSGGSVVRNASSIALKRVEAKREMPSAAIFTATGLSEVASWDTEQQMGLFTRHFLEGIRGKADDKNFFGNGDGKVTVGELKEYLQEEVTYRARRMYGRNQNPQISGMDGKVLTKLR